MKSVNVKKKGFYYDRYQKKTLFLEKGVITVNDGFAKLIVDHKGGDYCEVEKVKKEVDKGMDYSVYDLTSGAKKLAKEKELSAEFMDQVKGTGVNGRISKEDLEDEMVEDFDEKEGDE